MEKNKETYYTRGTCMPSPRTASSSSGLGDMLLRLQAPLSWLPLAHHPTAGQVVQHGGRTLHPGGAPGAGPEGASGCHPDCRLHIAS